MEFTNWRLKGKNMDIQAHVPGDIVMDHYIAGLIEDPYFGLNHKNLTSVTGADFTYVNTFDYNEKFDKNSEEVVLTFGGVDLFSEIYLNGVLLGKTDNMFLSYEFIVSDILKAKDNVLEVKMSSTTRYMDNLDTKDYFGVFNVPRVLIRKEQCCFGWDWAPNVPSYGIWEPVTLNVRSKDRITEVYYTANTNGEAIIHLSLNYFKRSGYDKFGNFIEVKEKYNDEIKVSLAKTPFGKDYEVKTFKVCGNKAFVAFSNPKAQLWWPVGYGEQPLYNYKVELFREGKLISSYSGRLAYRTTELKQEMLGDQMLSYQFYINGKRVFIKGSNWVPIDCFTGCITYDKYEKLIKQAKASNFNMLRVWGGGIYEKDAFYDICDEQGLMVWQDFMFACGDIPDNDKDWLDNAIKECNYQVKRLRNHPSLIYWCGGNEKTGSFGTMVTYGDYFVDTVLRGIVANNDSSRPYGRQSPCSFTDVGNDKNSGESHHNCFELSLEKGIENYRSLVADTVVPFVSECAIMGPNSKQTFLKIFPQDKMWPMNEYWVDRLMDNPYAAIKMSFCERQKYYVSKLYGEPHSVEDFIKKAMLVHSEALKCEVEFSRAHKGTTCGWLNWMYSEIWPTGTWSIIDFYTEPKMAYYQMEKSLAPVLMSFYKDNEGKTLLFGVNDTLQDKEVKFTYGLKKLSGEVVWKSTGKTTLNTVSAYSRVIDKQVNKEDCYLFVKYSYDGVEKTILYSDDLWKNYTFLSRYTFNKKAINNNKVEITFKADSFVKDVFINHPENCDITYSDNYFDLEAGETKTITMTSKNKIDVNKIEVTDYAK